jgi:hypothetical protein
MPSSSLIVCVVFAQVEMCKSFGDPTKARAWSKHSRGPATAPRENNKVQYKDRAAVKCLMFLNVSYHEMFPSSSGHVYTQGPG